MKRFVFALFVSCIGVAASAASVEWGVSGFAGNLTGIAYFVQVDSSVTVEAIKSHLAAKGTSTAGVDSSKYTVWSTANEDPEGGFAYGGVFISESLVSEAGNFVVILIDGGKVTVSTEIMTATPAGSPLDTPPNLTGFVASDTWYDADPSAVPEPTALALLALGVAGLALRRKVA